MANAARNLTPVTLELGGKSPAIVAPDFPIKTAAERILWAKTFNAGQICLAVDHVYLPRGAETEFVDHCKRLFAKRYPDINGPDFTSIIDQRSYDRLTAALEDARAKGATLINLAEGQTPDASRRKFPPHLALNPTAEMEIMRREIFGPILPIRLYDQPEEVVDAVNAGDRPLALYPFTNDPRDPRLLHLARDVGRRRRSTTPIDAMSPSTTCRSAGSARAAWGTITAARASRPSRNCVPSSSRGGFRRCRC